MSTETAAMTGSPPKTMSGVSLDGLGFWFFLCMLEGAAWVMWTLLEIQNHYYFSTTPFGTTGQTVPW